MPALGRAAATNLTIESNSTPPQAIKTNALLPLNDPQATLKLGLWSFLDSFFVFATSLFILFFFCHCNLPTIESTVSELIHVHIFAVIRSPSLLVVPLLYGTRIYLYYSLQIGLLEEESYIYRHSSCS